MTTTSKSFGGVLDWHLRNGTRPDGPGHPWTNKTFASAFVTTVGERSVRNWRKGRHVPSAIDHIERALFGSNETNRYEAWRQELRAAYRESARNNERAISVA